MRAVAPTAAAEIEEPLWNVLQLPQAAATQQRPVAAGQCVRIPSYGDGGEGGGRRDGVPLDTEGGSEDDVIKALMGVKMEELIDSLCRLHA